MHRFMPPHVLSLYLNKNLAAGFLLPEPLRHVSLRTDASLCCNTFVFISSNVINFDNQYLKFYIGTRDLLQLCGLHREHTGDSSTSLFILQLLSALLEHHRPEHPPRYGHPLFLKIAD
jgi:hypothetical protein